MGKAEDEQPLPSTPLEAQGTIPVAGTSNGCCFSCTQLRNSLNFRCLFALVLGVAVLLSAVFWLPFFRFEDHKDLDLDYQGHDIVASFMLRKPASFLEDHILQLQGDIFDEMSFSSVEVEIIALEPSAEPNRTKVVFAAESDLTTRSLIRDSFMYIISNQSVLHLTTQSLFGDPFSFEVLKFRGGITASPEQKAFLMQSGQIRFNFTLNYSIDQILHNFDELRSQLRTGLHLALYENLYISLTNLKGSTVDPPTTVESKVLLAVGINFSQSRIKQLAQTITGSHSKNLGLNNTVFGRVKQVRLSSTLLHSLGSGESSLSPSPSPSPSLSPLSQSHFHHHHHHHHHPVVGPSPHISPSPSMRSHKSETGRGSSTSTPVPAPAPAPAPTPEKTITAAPPACHFGNGNKFPYTVPSAAPVYTPNAAPSQPTHPEAPPPKPSPAPAPGPPYVPYAHSHPPSNGEVHTKPLDIMVSPSPSPSSAGVTGSNTRALLMSALVILVL